MIHLGRPYDLVPFCGGIIVTRAQAVEAIDLCGIISLRQKRAFQRQWNGKAAKCKVVILCRMPLAIFESHLPMQDSPCPPNCFHHPRILGRAPRQEGPCFGMAFLGGSPSTMACLCRPQLQRRYIPDWCRASASSMGAPLVLPTVNRIGAARSAH